VGSNGEGREIAAARHIRGDGKDSWRQVLARFAAQLISGHTLTCSLFSLCFLLGADGSVQVAKRRAILPAGEDFFGHVALLQRLKSKLMALRVATLRHLTDQSAASAGCWCPPPHTLDALTLLVFGELYGGRYPHLSVKPVPGVQAVQTGIWYSPDVEFCAFDLAVAQPSASHTYLDYQQALELFRQCDVPHAAPLFVGKLPEAIAYPLGFQSKVAQALHKLPALPDNKAEGVVIKPMRELQVTAAGKTSGGGKVRVIFKRKIPEFSEDRRYSGAKKWDDDALSPSTVSSVQHPQQALARLLLEADAHLVPPRLAAAISKIGPISAENRPRLKQVLQLLHEEVLDELGRQLPGMLQILQRTQRQQLEEAISSGGKQLILQRLKEQQEATAATD
jgi:Rnl2 family RNA ligase